VAEHPSRGGARCLRQLPPVRNLPMIHWIIGLSRCDNRFLTPPFSLPLPVV